MRIGTMYLGRVDAFLGEAIETKFFVFGVPLFPLSSFYIVKGRQGFEIPLHGKSVLLGYARVATWIGALLWGILGWVTKHYHQGVEILIGPVILGVVAAVLTWGVGRVPRGERTKRLVLRATAGVAAPPHILPADVRSDLLAKLEKEWAEKYPSRKWQDAVVRSDTKDDQRPLLFALASYALDDVRTEQAWGQMQKAA